MNASARDVIRQSLTRYPESTRLVWVSPDLKYQAVTYVPRQGMPGDVIDLVFVSEESEEAVLDGSDIRLFGIWHTVKEGRCRFLLEAVWNMANSHPLWEPTLIVCRNGVKEVWEELPPEE